MGFWPQNLTAFATDVFVFPHVLPETRGLTLSSLLLQQALPSSQRNRDRSAQAAEAALKAASHLAFRIQGLAGGP